MEMKEIKIKHCMRCIFRVYAGDIEKPVCLLAGKEDFLSKFEAEDGFPDGKPSECPLDKQDFLFKAV